MAEKVKSSYPKCKKCGNEMSPIMLAKNHSMNWECKVCGVFDKQGKQIIEY
jgi:ribosomal protein S27AE